MQAQQQAYTAATYNAVAGIRAYGAAAAATTATQPPTSLTNYAVAAGWVKFRIVVVLDFVV